MKATYLLDTWMQYSAFGSNELAIRHTEGTKLLIFLKGSKSSSLLRRLRWGSCLTLLSTISLVWCSVFPQQNLAKVLTSMVTQEGKGLTMSKSLSYWLLFPSSYSFRAWHQNNVSSTLYSIVQLPFMFAVQKEVTLYSQGAGVHYLRGNLLQTMKKKGKLGIKTFPVVFLYSVSSSSWTVVEGMWR